MLIATCDEIIDINRHEKTRSSYLSVECGLVIGGKAIEISNERISFAQYYALT